MKQRYYAIKRPDGSWVMAWPQRDKDSTWVAADSLIGLEVSDEDRWIDEYKAAGYRCVEVDGFREVEK